MLSRFTSVIAVVAAVFAALLIGVNLYGQPPTGGGDGKPPCTKTRAMTVFCPLVTEITPCNGYPFNNTVCNSKKQNEVKSDYFQCSDPNENLTGVSCVPQVTPLPPGQAGPPAPVTVECYRYKKCVLNMFGRDPFGCVVERDGIWRIVPAAIYETTPECNSAG